MGAESREGWKEGEGGGGGGLEEVRKAAEIDGGYPGDGGVRGNLPPGLLLPDLLVFIVQILREEEGGSRRRLDFAVKTRTNERGRGSGGGGVTGS